MAYLLLYGNGWTQRWFVTAEMEAQVRSQIEQVGTASTGRITVVDPGSESEATLVVSWALVAAAVLLESAPGSEDVHTPGQYA